MEIKRHIRFFDVLRLHLPHFGSIHPSPTPQAVHFCSEKKRWCLDNHEETPEGKVLTVFKQPTGFCKKIVPRPPEDLSESSHFQSSKISHSKNNKKDYTQHSIVGFLSFFVNSQEVFLRIVCFLSFCSSTVWATFPPGGFLRKELLFQLSAETTSSAFQEPVLVGTETEQKLLGEVKNHLF